LIVGVLSATSFMNAVDTNILIYAISADAEEKGRRALDLLDSLSAADTVLPWQVACKCGAVLTKLVHRKLADNSCFESCGRFG
jgi:predicted nucleic acid-binding protein